MTHGEFGKVYLDLRGDMLKAARKMLKVREDAEDIVQQTFCDVLSSGHLDDLDSTRNVRAFIFCKLMWNTQQLIQRLTRDPIEPLIYEGDNADDPSNDPLAVLIDDDRRIDIDRALAMLPVDQRAVLSSVIMTGRTFIETGRALWPGLEPYARRYKASRLYKQGLRGLQVILKDYRRI